MWFHPYLTSALERKIEEKFIDLPIRANCAFRSVRPERVERKWDCHADIQTTMIYVHLRPDALLEEMEKCFGNGRAAGKNDVENLFQTVEVLRAENRSLRERLGAAAIEEHAFMPLGHT